MVHSKIIITGVTCAGKTTLGKKLSKKLAMPQIDLDEFYFLPNWVEKEKSQFVNDVQEALNTKPAWIVTGNFQSLLKDAIYKEATTIIWLDYPLGLVIHRYFIRTFRRLFLREKCCGENYETFAQVFSRDSLFFWIFKSYWYRKKRMKNWQHTLFSDKNWLVLEKPREAKELLKTL